MAGMSGSAARENSVAAFLEEHEDLAAEVRWVRRENGSVPSGRLSLEEIVRLAERWSRNDVPPILDASGFYQVHRERSWHSQDR